MSGAVGQNFLHGSDMGWQKRKSGKRTEVVPFPKQGKANKDEQGIDVEKKEGASQTSSVIKN